MQTTEIEIIANGRFLAVSFDGRITAERQDRNVRGDTATARFSANSVIG